MDSLYIQKVLNGDPSAFSYFVKNYKDMAYSIAFRILNNNEDAEEIVQDSFMRAFKSLKKFRHDSKFSTWFYKIVVNNSLTKAKRRKPDVKSNNLEEAEDRVIEEIEGAYANLSQADRQKHINFALNKLEAEDSLLLTLYYLNENSIEEIAEITSMKKENIKMRVHRARKKMYFVLEKVLKSEIKNLL